jgi:ABC-2 type transport system permease protein
VISRRAPGAVRALAAVAELRALLFWHRLRGRGGVAEGIAQVLGLGVACVGGLLAAAATGAGSFRAARVGHGLQVSAGLAAILFGLWVAWTALSLTVNERDLLDLRRLLVYPVPPGRLYLTAVAAAMAADPLAVFMGVALAGVLAGAAVARPGWWLVPLALLLALFAAATVAAVTLAQEVLARFARSRWFREVAILAAVVGWAGLVLLGSAGRLPWGTVRLLARIRWLFFPPALASEGARHLYEGDGLAALPWLCALALAGGCALALAYRVAMASALSGGEGTAAPRGSRGTAGALWPERIGPLLEKEARYVVRHPLSRISLVLVPALAAFLAWRGGPGIARQQSEMLRALPLFGIAAYAHLALQIFWLNAFGWDRGGARAFFLAPVAPERVLAAKNLAVMGYGGVVFVAGSAAWLAVAGGAPTWATGGAVVLHLAMAPALHAGGNVVSIANPRAAAFGVQQRAALPHLSALAGMVLFSGVALLFAWPIFLALWLDAPWIAVGAWAALGAAAWTIWWTTMPAAGRLLVRRRDELVAAVGGDDEG